MRFLLACLSTTVCLVVVASSCRPGPERESSDLGSTQPSPQEATDSYQRQLDRLIDDVPELVPDHSLVRTEDLSYGGVIRYNVRVQLPAHYSREQVLAVSKALVADRVSAGPVDALSMMFFSPAADGGGQWDVASVNWAPSGEWQSAESTSHNDYDSYRYDITYVPAPNTSSRMRPASSKGLLGAVIPEGAQRMSSSPETADEDAREKYAVSASAEDLRAFFRREMPNAGWTFDGSPTQSMLTYRAPGKIIAVLVSKDGEFLLMGGRR